jgi:hypothetical protein
MISTVLIASFVVAAICIALGAAYSAGMLDGLIEKVSFYVFKAEAKAEKEKLKSEGMQEGKDFVAGE